mmetsp:Transcript_8789/g.11546  ORF Transcript_8789/g.11546 Transcript_8789/m.11546 type:complete len:163 (+) Transcript_8789:145-633(+)
MCDHLKKGHECHKTSVNFYPLKKNQNESNAELNASLKGEIEALKDTVADLQRQISEFQKVCPQKQDLPPQDPPSGSLEEEMEVTGDSLEDEMEAKEEQWKNHSWVDNPCPIPDCPLLCAPIKSYRSVGLCSSCGFNFEAPKHKIYSCGNLHYHCLKCYGLKK